MKSILTLVAVLYFFGLNGHAARIVDIESDAIPVFVKSMKLLHRGPPKVRSNRGMFNIVTKTIEQKLDHFDANVTQTWQMRYMVNDEYFKAGGPLFIYLGGEWEIAPDAIAWGHFVDMAREHNGYLCYTEHRFYGKSRPTSSLTIGDLKYLHVKQALADLAHFIRTIKQNVAGLENSKVVIVGCSYSATMVVWMKRLYPDLIDGGWASSAPILAKLDFKEYEEVVGRAYLELGSQACYDRIHNGIAELEYMIGNKRNAEVKAMLKICNNFEVNNECDVYSLFNTITSLFSSIAQNQVGNVIPDTCNYLMNFEDDLSAITNFVITKSDTFNCMDTSYLSGIKFITQTTYEIGDSRQWAYQTCNEYGWFQTSTSKNQPFGNKFPVHLATQICKDLFGQKYTKAFIEQQIAQTNVDFGGMNPEVENIYMTHGALDPWNPVGLGVLEGATVIPRASHCSDLSSISLDDSKEMRASKERIAEMVRGWVGSKMIKNKKDA